MNERAKREYYNKVIAKLITTSRASITSEIMDDILKESIVYHPKRLYKYRPCNEDTFDMLREEYLWASAPCNFLDHFDAKIHLRFKQDYKAIKQWLSKRICEWIFYWLPPKGLEKRKKGRYILKDIEAMCNEYLTADGRVRVKELKKRLAVEMGTLSHKQKEEVVNFYKKLESGEFQDEWFEKLQKSVEEFQDHFRKTKKVCCLTENLNNHALWENYACKHKGICIEYSLEDMLAQTDETKYALCQLFPVRYYKRIPRVSLEPLLEYQHEKMIGKPLSDISEYEQEVNKQLLYKREEYRYEEEWRIVLPQGKENKISFPLITAVYMGMNISKTSEEKVLRICRRKGYKAYKQVLRPLAREYEYEPVL